MDRKIPKNLALPDGGDESGLMPILWQRVADFGGRILETPNGMVERTIDDVLLYTAWMASCHVGAASVNKGWRGFSLRKMSREANGVLMTTRHYIREALSGFSGDVNKYFTGSAGVRESGEVDDKFGSFFSDSFKAGLDRHVRKLLDRKRQIVLQEGGVKNKIKGLSSEELESGSVALQGIIDAAVERIEAVLFSAAHHVGVEVIDVDKCAGASNFVELFCYDAIAEIRRNPRYDTFFSMVLSWFVDSNSPFYNFVMIDDETVWSKEQKQSAWYLQFETAVAGLHQLFVGTVAEAQKSGSDFFPDSILCAKTERILREIFQSLKACGFSSSADELVRQIDFVGRVGARADVPVRDSGAVVEVKDFDMLRK